jgi:uncharacterized OB-fold protein
MMNKPAPKLTPINRPYWEGCNEGRLMLQRCRAEGCGKYNFAPRVCCPHCGSDDLAWEQASGKARVLTHAIIHHPLNEAFAGDVPFIFAAVTLDEGPMLYTRIEMDPADSEGLDGRAVSVVFKDDQLPGQTLPFFRPL